MAISFRNILLVALVTAPSLASPTWEPANTVHLSPLSDHPCASTSHVSSIYSPFRRLRDTIIETIWPETKEQKTKYARPGQGAPLNFRKRYGNDAVLRFTFQDEEEVKAFQQAADVFFLDVWDSSSNWIDVRIAKEMLPSFLSLLPPSMQHSYKPLMYDLATAVLDTYPTNPASGFHPWKSKQPAKQGTSDLFFDDYQPLSVIYPWLRLLSSLYPDLTNLTSIGSSAEGRNIPALRIGSRRGAKPGEPVHTVLIVGGSHAREWISVSTTTYIAYTLLTRYTSGTDPVLTKFLDHYDIVFVPVLNPDGYEYTWTTDRLWRKSRQPTDLPFCPGIDIDRAFPFQWDGHADVGNPCTESFAGSKPLEAVEAKALVDWTKNETEHGNTYFSAYLDLHSYSQKILYPFAYSCRAEPHNFEDLEEVAFGLSKNFRVTTGLHYDVESACEGTVTSGPDSKPIKAKGLFPGESGGSSLDFFFAMMNIKYAFQIKLRDVGTYGFLLPKENIVPSGRETVEAVIGLGRWLLGNRGIESKIVDDQETQSLSDKDIDVLGDNKAETDSAPKSESDSSSDSEWERVYDPEFELRRRR